MNHSRLLAALLATLPLTGCIWAPGQHLRSSDVTRDHTSEDGRLQLIQITPKLIAMNKAAQSEPTLPDSLFNYQPEAYRIGRGDVLNITVWDHPELTVPAGSQQSANLAGRLVQSDGTLFYPYIGKVIADGKTPMQLREEISQRLAKYIESPQVEVAVLTYASQHVWINGATEAPVTLSLGTAPLTIGDALGQAGLNSLQADLSGIKLTRDGVTYALDLERLAQQSRGRQIYLKSGDNIYVPYLDRKEVAVVGEVVLPGAYSFRTGNISLSQALGRAHGLAQSTSNGNAVYVIRGSRDMQKEPSTIYQLEARSPTAFAAASQFDLQPGDVVFVGAAGITRWNRFISQLLPFTSIIYSAAETRNEVQDN